MELKWLQDILVLHEEKNFSRAAIRRNVTQPAFSRRIRMLEQWIGVDLIDRKSQPIQFLPVVDKLMPDIAQLVMDFYRIRNEVKADAMSSGITIAAQHTLTSTTFPRMLSALERHLSPLTMKLRTGDLDQCIVTLERREADFLMCYKTPLCPHDLLDDCEYVQLEQERLIPVTAAEDGVPVHNPAKTLTLKMLNYPAKSFLRQVIDRGRLAAAMQDYTIENVCESSLTVALKELTLARMGICWLPRSLVEQELESAVLVSLEHHFGTIDLEVNIYKSPFRFNSSSSRLWNLLQEKYGTNDEMETVVADLSLV